MKRARGFSLIEIMVVVAIIGLFATTITFTVSGSRGNTTYETAQTLAHRLQYAREFALVRQATMGLRLDADEYQFVSWQADLGEEGRWQRVRERGLNQQRIPFEHRIEISSAELDLAEQEEELSVSSFADAMSGDDDRDGGGRDEEDNEEPFPQLLIMPSGELPRLVIRVSDREAADESWIIAKDQQQRLRIINEREWEALP